MADFFEQSSITGVGKIASTGASIDCGQRSVIAYLTTGFACSPFGPWNCTSRKDGLVVIGHWLAY